MFVVPGEPTGKGRPRKTKWGMHTPEKTVLYENLVKTCYNGKFHNGALRMTITANYAIPKSASKKKVEQMLKGELFPTKKPDCDNVIKIIADALNEIAYKDDCQIVSLHIEKRYSHIPQIIVEIEEVFTSDNETSEPTRSTETLA